MIFNSASFLLFLPVAFMLYWFINRYGQGPRNVFIVIASYIFYGWWDWRFLILIFVSTIIDYRVGQLIANSSSRKKKKGFLVLSLFVNLGLLGFFKYFNFFVDSFITAINSIGWDVDTWSLNIILPVGISFYTFQTLSYSIDIWKGELKPAVNFWSFAAFVGFFPQLVAGPIERARNLLPQFESKRVFDYNNAVHGVTLIVYGFFKKIVVADRLAIYVNSSFDNLESMSTVPLLLTSLFFAFQIYCDFSGYSSIARGIAKLLGFELMVNFSRPYLSKNIVEFWRRWHISLSTWFKDYVYIPLGGNRVSRARNYTNVYIVFLVSGLWHGANWTYVIWGALHGVYQIIYLQFFRKNNQIKLNWLKSLASVLFVFLLVCIAWVFFRAKNLDQAIMYFDLLLDFDWNYNLAQWCAFKGPFNLVLSFVALLLLGVTYLFKEDLNFNSVRKHFVFAFILSLIIILIGVNGEPNFIYFQF